MCVWLGLLAIKHCRRLRKPFSEPETQALQKICEASCRDLQQQLATWAAALLDKPFRKMVIGIKNDQELIARQYDRSATIWKLSNEVKKGKTDRTSCDSGTQSFWRYVKNALGGERIQDGHELSCLWQHVDPPVPQLMSLWERLEKSQASLP